MYDVPVKEIGDIRIINPDGQMKRGSVGFTVTSEDFSIRNIFFWFNEWNYQRIYDKVKKIRQNLVDSTRNIKTDSAGHTDSGLAV